MRPVREGHLDEGQDVCHQSCRHVDDKLVDTGNGVGPATDIHTSHTGQQQTHTHTAWSGESRARAGPDGGALVGEELDELGDEDVEGSVEGIRVQLVIAILTDLVQSTECTL